MTLENTTSRGSQAPDSALENTGDAPKRRPGRVPVSLPDVFAAVLGDYTANLAKAPLSAQTRRTYV